MLMEKVQRWFIEGSNSATDTPRSQDNEVQRYHPTFHSSSSSSSDNNNDNRHRKVTYNHPNIKRNNNNSSSYSNRRVEAYEGQSDSDSSPLSSGRHSSRTQSAEVISANSTVSLAIANSIIGNLFGPKVSNSAFIVFLYTTMP